MNYLLFLLNFAKEQRRLGRGVSPKELEAVSGMPKSTIHRYLKVLVENEILYRVEHGKYKVISNDATRSVGFVTITPMDFYIYNSDKE